jgi:putative DNA primase/helicase
MTVDWDALAVGEHRIVCPGCGRGPRDRTLGATIEYDGHGVAHCFRCGLVESHCPDRPPVLKQGTAPARPIVVKHATLSEYGVKLFADSVPLAGTIGEIYLRDVRKCPLPPADGDLRFHPALKHPSGYVGPALVARVTDALTNVPMSLHRTWILPDRKADVDPPRLLLKDHRKAGGVIRLWPDEAVTTNLGIAEGVESSLSLAHAFKPAWAAIDAGNLGAFPVLAGVESLTIAADHDPTGMNAAEACASRWTEAGREVRLVLPDLPGADLNDIARETA